MYARIARRPSIAAGVLVLLVLSYLGVLGFYTLTGSSSSLLNLHGHERANNTDTEWPEAQDKIIVMARLRNESTDWVEEYLPDWQHAIYTVDDRSAPLKPPKNKGRESMVYLTYIADNYDRLPSTVAFLHPHRDGWPGGWHTDASNYDNVISAHDMRLDFIQSNGYANLRCLPTPGCPDEIRPFREDHDPQKPHEIAFVDVWMYLFGNEKVPEVVATPCCSQWAASRNQIRQRTREEYIHYRQWLMDTPLNDYTSGRIMEYLWHIIMKKDPV